MVVVVQRENASKRRTIPRTTVRKLGTHVGSAKKKRRRSHAGKNGDPTGALSKGRIASALATKEKRR